MRISYQGSLFRFNTSISILTRTPYKSNQNEFKLAPIIRSSAKVDGGAPEIALDRPGIGGHRRSLLVGLYGGSGAGGDRELLPVVFLRWRPP